MGTGNEILTAVVLIIGVSLIVFSLALIVMAIVAYRIAALYAPQNGGARPVPGFGQTVTKLAGGRIVDRQDTIEGVNGYPDTQNEVAETAVVTEVTGAAEGTLAAERERWWDEKREEGYDDDEIVEMERNKVVPVFEGA